MAELARGAMAGDGALETARLTLGFVPLADCAPLVVARERGFFERHGLSVELSREASWATIRDKISVEALDGGMMIGAMPLAATLGLGGLRTPMVVGLNLDLNGNSVTISTSLWAEVEAAHGCTPVGPVAVGAALRAALADRKRRGLAVPRFAVTFPYSSHNYLLRYWLAGSGIDPDRDVRLVVVPPPRMLSHLVEGAVDGYCVGAPWGQIAVDLGVGRFALATCDIWNNHPEKVFGTTRAWAERNPNTHLAVAMSLLEACRWLDDPENRADAARLVARSDYVDAPPEIVAATFAGMLQVAPGVAPRSIPDFHVFHRYAANFPWRSHALWTLVQMRRWGQVGPSVDFAAIADAVFRPDICRAAARRLGMAIPAVDHKPEGVHAAVHVDGDCGMPLGPDLFFDGATFDPTASLTASAKATFEKETDR